MSRSWSALHFARAAARVLGPGVLGSTVNCHSPAILTVSDAFVRNNDKQPKIIISLGGTTMPSSIKRAAI